MGHCEGPSSPRDAGVGPLERPALQLSSGTTSVGLRHKIDPLSKNIHINDKKRTIYIPVRFTGGSTIDESRLRKTLKRGDGPKNTSWFHPRVFRRCLKHPRNYFFSKGRYILRINGAKMSSQPKNAFFTQNCSFFTENWPFSVYKTHPEAPCCKREGLQGRTGLSTPNP